MAFTHKSVAAETVGNYHVSNERMEYLGDTVLSTAVADYLFHTYPTQPEGFLTEMRSRIVSRVSLNKLSQKLGFDEYIRHAPDMGNNARSMTGSSSSMQSTSSSPSRNCKASSSGKGKGVATFSRRTWFSRSRESRAYI